MATTIPPIRYQDPEYQKAHNNLFLGRSKQPLEHVLPPGVSQGDFDQAVKELVQALGKANIFTGEAIRDYVDPYEVLEVSEGRKVPSAAVTPASLEALQAVLRIANRLSIPVWTFSLGKNIGYGGPAPRLPGSLAVDLHRMNKIIEVNEKFAYAVVEPGVTFTDLYTYCAAKKLEVWPSVPSLGWGSVIGNTVDRGTGFTPTASHWEHIVGLEVVLADGEIVRTGQWAKSGSPSSHLSKFSFGPSLEGLFLQSNLGIVTKMGIALTPQPQAFMSCAFDMPEPEDIGAIVDIFGDMRRKQIIPTTVYVFNIVEWSAIFGTHADYWDKLDEPIPPWRLKEVQKQLDTGFWTVRFMLYGPEKVVQAHYEEAAKVVAKRMPTGHLRRTLFSAGDGQTLEPTAVPLPYGGMFVGVPSLWSLPLVSYTLPKDGSGVGAHSAYSAIIPLDGKIMSDWVVACKQVYEAEGFDAMCDFFMHEKHAVFVCMLIFDKTNPKQCAAVDRIFHKLFQEGAKRGFSKYRAHVNHMDMVSDQNDFNNFAYRRFVEKIKDALDPNGILSPGKQGIWPKKYRHFRDATPAASMINGVAKLSV